MCSGISSKQAATISLTCTLLSDSAVNQAIDLHFAAACQKFNLTLKALCDNVSADGETPDTVLATLSVNNAPAQSQKLLFELPKGSPATLNSSSSPQIVTTDNKGQANIWVRLSSGQAATIPLTCSLLSDNTVNQVIDLHFTAVARPPQPTCWPFKIIVNGVNQATLRRNYPQAPNYYWCQILRVPDSPGIFPAYRIELKKYPPYNGALQIPGTGFSNNYMIFQSCTPIYLGILNSQAGHDHVFIDIYDENGIIHLWRGNIDPFFKIAIPN